MVLRLSGKTRVVLCTNSYFSMKAIEPSCILKITHRSIEGRGNKFEGRKHPAGWLNDVVGDCAASNVRIGLEPSLGTLRDMVECVGDGVLRI